MSIIPCDVRPSKNQPATYSRSLLTIGVQSLRSRLMASLTTNPAAQPRTFLSPNRAASIAFVPTGVVNVLLGPLLPALAARWSLNDAQAGELFMAQFLASTVGVLCSGMLVPRFGYRAVIAMGLILMAFG